MFRTILSLCIYLFLASSNAQDLGAIEEGTYLLHGRNGPPKPFSVKRAEDKWEIKSADSAFPLGLVNCLPNCDFRPMSESLQQATFPQFMQQFTMSCIGSSAFALCKMMNRPMRDCSKGPFKVGETCQVGSQPLGKPIYGLFALFAPGVMPISVTREASK